MSVITNQKVQPPSSQPLKPMPDKIMFQFNSCDGYMKRSFLREGWVENNSSTVNCLSTVKWEYSDAVQAIKSLRPNQLFNHFPDSREITTKQGLNKTLNSISQPGTDIYDFYPRSYDLSEYSQVDAFTDDFT
jgi:hypothetical protein